MPKHASVMAATNMRLGVRSVSGLGFVGGIEPGSYHMWLRFAFRGGRWARSAPGHKLCSRFESKTESCRAATRSECSVRRKPHGLQLFVLSSPWSCGLRHTLHSLRVVAPPLFDWRIVQSVGLFHFRAFSCSSRPSTLLAQFVLPN